MKAYVLDAINEFSIKEVLKPTCGQNEVLVRVDAAGICGSDIPRVYKTGTYHYPLIPGHEFSGTVVECTENTSYWQNKRVGIFPLIPCMECPQCKKRQYEMCSNYNYLGSRTHGGFAEYVKVPEWNLIELPDSVSLKAAAMFEPMAVAVHAARNAGLIDCDCDRETRITVMGIGTIGLSLIMMLLGEGYKNVYGVGNKEIQKKAALEIGLPAKHYIDIKEYVKEENLVDVFFDCVGTDTVIDAALNSVLPRGKVVCVGNPASDMKISQKSYWIILRKQLTLIGTWNSSFTHEKNDDWHYVIKKITSGKISPEKLISHTFDFDGLMKGFELMRDKSEEYIKVMMENGK